MEDLAFFVLYRSKASGGRRFHGQQRDDLEKVVLDDVAQAAGGFVKRAALATPKSSASVIWTLAT